jgi:hypothetical protein
VIQADYSENRWTTNGGFQKPMRLLGPIASVVSLRGSKADSWLEEATGDTTQSQQYTGHAGLASNMTVPGLAINLTHDLNYDISRGYVNQSRGLFVATSVPTGDQDQFSTVLSLRTNIPKTTIMLNMSSHYSQTNILDGAETSRLGYKGGATYGWNFGMTKFSCNGDYSSERVDTDNGPLGVMRTTENVTSLYLKMTRRLF